MTLSTDQALPGSKEINSENQIEVSNTLGNYLECFYHQSLDFYCAIPQLCLWHFCLALHNDSNNMFLSSIIRFLLRHFTTVLMALLFSITWL